MRKCECRGCKAKMHARGLCDTHYRQWRRDIGYEPPVRSWNDPGVPERFWRKVAPSLTGCWEWTGGVNSKGYGLFFLDGGAQLAHRVAWEACEGAIPEGLTVDHWCENKLCVNPAHMEVVTRAENARRSNRHDSQQAAERGIYAA